MTRCLPGLQAADSTGTSHHYKSASNITTMDEFKNYPFLTGEEFSEACHHLDRRYCQARLGPVRRQWRLHVCTAFNTSFSLGLEYNTYLQIVRPLHAELDDAGLSSCLESFSFGGDGSTDQDMDVEGDRDMIAAEEADEVWKTKPLSAAQLVSLTAPRLR